jgi:acetyltransferase-like isoleucine patch superfamily enzyme
MLKQLYKVYSFFAIRIGMRLDNLITRIIFTIHGVSGKSFTSLGVPLLNVYGSGKCQFGSNLVMVNSAKHSTLGKSNRCKFVVSANANLTIGNKVGMSNVTIVATKSIVIGNNIMIGGGVTIVDSDFHSLNPLHWHTNADEKNMISSPVHIKDNVFIGMDSIILKGVTIGSNVIIAAGSVVFKDIPDNQIWGGNPANFIRDNKNNSLV